MPSSWLYNRKYYNWIIRQSVRFRVVWILRHAKSFQREFAIRQLIENLFCKYGSQHLILLANRSESLNRNMPSLFRESFSRNAHGNSKNPKWNSVSGSFLCEINWLWKGFQLLSSRLTHGFALVCDPRHSRWWARWPVAQRKLQPRWFEAKLNKLCNSPTQLSHLTDCNFWRHCWCEPYKFYGSHHRSTLDGHVHVILPWRSCKWLNVIQLV